ncbi:MAG TPA: glycosyltransferase family 2 protein [Actinospica sp.]|nr:glycosyltransferase family 2 protein [Actinospica sp.]
MKLSILMAAYNEERTVAHVAASVLATEYPCPIELIIVNDGSKDRTAELLAEIADPRVTVLTHQVNRGKSAALATAIEAATGTHMLPFDADMEYDSEDIPALIEPVLRGRCEVVYGTRLFGQNTVYQSFRYALGNKALTLAANMLFDASISDLHTCLKLIPLPLVRSMRLDANGFGMDTELTARLLRLGVRPFEVPVSYHSRSRAEGKKISWQDGVHCLRILAGVRFSAKPAQVVPNRRPALPVRPVAPTRHIPAAGVRAHTVGKPPAKPTGLNGAAVLGVAEPAVAGNAAALSLGES